MIYFDKIYLDEVQNKPNYYSLVKQSRDISLSPSNPNVNVIDDIICPKVSTISNTTLRRYHTEEIFTSP